MKIKISSPLVAIAIPLDSSHYQWHHPRITKDYRVSRLCSVTGFYYINSFHYILNLVIRAGKITSV